MDQPDAIQIQRKLKHVCPPATKVIDRFPQWRRFLCERKIDLQCLGQQFGRLFQHPAGEGIRLIAEMLVAVPVQS